MSNVDITSMFVGAADKVESEDKTFGNMSSVYKRAAVISSNKLGKNVTEYDIIASQLAVTEAQIAMTPQNPELYTDMVKYTFLLAKFSPTIGKEHFQDDMLSNVESALTSAIKAPEMPKVGPWDAVTAAE